jgi:hypothetical protein
MATCKSCGTEIGEGKFCPACGMAQGENSAANSAPIAPAPSPSVMGDTQGQTTPQASNTVPYYSQQGPSDMPNRSGQMVFSIVNLVLGVLFCCCGGAGFFTMVIGIITTVLSTQVDKAATADEARRKLKTIMILNIVAIGLLVLGLIGTFAWAAINGTSTNYSYDYYNNLLD